VAFEREATCGPILRDRVAGTSTSFFPGQPGSSCPVTKANLGMSGDGQRILVQKLAAQCPASTTPVYAPAVSALSVIDVVSGTSSDLVPCTDRTFYAPSSYEGYATNTAIPPAAASLTTGTIVGAVLTGDGASVVVLRNLSDLTYGVVGQTCAGPCYGVTSYVQRQVVDRLPVAGGEPVRLATLRSTGTIATPTGLVAPPIFSFALMTLAATDATGSVVTLLSDVALSAADTNGTTDGYVVQSSGSVSPVVVTSAGTSTGDLSANGRFLLFSSAATDLVPEDTNGHADLFLLDRQSGAIERQSVGTGGTQSNRPTTARPSSVSDDGRFVAFGTDASTLGCSGNYVTAYVRDRTNNRTRSPFHRPSGAPATIGGTLGSSFSFTFLPQNSSVRLSGDGSTTVGVSADWLGATAADPGITATRLWATPTVQTVPDC
jgi:hypothetical protein